MSQVIPFPKLHNNQKKMTNHRCVQIHNNVHGKTFFSQSDISDYLQGLYAIESRIADKIAAFALSRHGGKINNEIELAESLGLEGLERTVLEKPLGVALESEMVAVSSEDATRIKALVMLFKAAADL